MKSAYLNYFSKNILKILTGLILLFSFLYILSPFFIPIILGGILAITLSPFVAYFMRKGFSRTKSINLIVVIIFVTGLVPTTIFLVRGASVIYAFFNKGEIINNILTIQDSIMHTIDGHIVKYGFSTEQFHQYIEQGIKALGSFLVNLFSKFLTQIPDMLLGALITFVSIYFFLVNEVRIKRIFLRYFYFSPENGERFIYVLKSSCREVFFSNVLTGLLQSIIVTLGAFFCNIGDTFIVFFITFICSFVPVVGAGPIAFILSLYSFFTGNLTSGIVMLVISIVSGVSDNILRPYLASKGEVEVDGLIIFLSVIGGVIVLGLPGLFVGPLLAALVFGLTPIILDEFFPQYNSDVSTEE